MVFSISQSELAATDRYERAGDYGRVEVTLVSGRKAWVYIASAPRPAN